MPEKEEVRVIVGVDTHADTHHVAVVTEHGRPLADQEFPATGPGYRQIIDFARSLGSIVAVGAECTGSYGAALTKVLRSDGLAVVKVNQPNRQRRRLRGKSDPLDAYSAAEAVLAERCTAVHKDKDGPVECLRVLRASRSSAMKAAKVGQRARCDSQCRTGDSGEGRMPGQAAADGRVPGIEQAGDYQVGGQECFGCRVVSQHAAQTGTHDNERPEVGFPPDQVNQEPAPVVISDPSGAGSRGLAVAGQIGDGDVGAQLRKPGRIRPHRRTVAAGAMNQQHPHRRVRIADMLKVDPKFPPLPS